MFGAAVGLAALAAQPAAATGLAPVQAGATACIAVGYGCIAGQSIDHFGTAVTDHAIASVSGNPGGAVYAHSEYRNCAVCSYNNAYGASAGLQYEVEYTGPYGVNVPFVIYFHDSTVALVDPEDFGRATATMFAQWQSIPTPENNYAYSGEFSFTRTSDRTGDHVTCYGACTGDFSSFSGSIESNTNAEINLGVSTGSNGTAYMDPLISIDPAWAAANPTLASQFHLEISAGVTNGFGTPGPGGVPEPATWSLMIAGLGLAGAALRRRGGAGVAAAL